MKKCIHILTNGDAVWHDTHHRTISIDFLKPRKVLSTSLLNGGYREDLEQVFNHNSVSNHGGCPILPRQTFGEHMESMASMIGFDPKVVTGMGTAALMENVSIKVEYFDALQVTAIVTGGVEVNGGRVGDPTEHYLTVDKNKLHKPGTINIMLVIDADLPPGMLARALVTCTEAKTAALQELLVGSNYSSGLATGSGTDQTLIIANPSSDLYFESAGKHSKLGELIGKVVKSAVKEALFKQHGLCPEQQHSVLRRLKRYGICSETLWEDFCVESVLERKEFEVRLCAMDRDAVLVSFVSLYVHLLDQVQWGLLTVEVESVSGKILEMISEHYGVLAVKTEGASIQHLVMSLQRQLVKLFTTQVIEVSSVM